MLTRKDFVKFAEIFRAQKPNETGFQQSVLLANWRQLIDDQCVVFKANNPRFDPIRFKTACNY